MKRSAAILVLLCAGLLSGGCVYSEHPPDSLAQLIMAPIEQHLGHDINQAGGRIARAACDRRHWHMAKRCTTTTARAVHRAGADTAGGILMGVHATSHSLRYALAPRPGLVELADPFADDLHILLGGDWDD